MQYSVLGNLMENDTPRVLRLQAQHLVQMPGDRFSLAVLIGSQPDLLRLFRRAFQLGHKLFLLGRDHVLRRIIVREINTKLFRLQVADMAVTRHDLIILPEKLLNGFRFGGRLHYNQILLHISCSLVLNRVQTYINN